MSSSSSSPDFSRPNNGYYDVFLSFRGTDTRFAFTNNLYRLLMEKEVHTFMDRDIVGKPIDSLFEIIRSSKMAVVVYSEGFAASDRCLRELDMILQRVKGKNMLVLPIFYKVQVGELKHLKGDTAKYLDAHIQEHGEPTVLKWKDAVTTLGKVNYGSSYKEDSYERDFIEDVINIIKRRLEKEWEETCIPKSNPKDVTECSKFIMSSSSSSPQQFSRPCPRNRLYDVFISFRGKDTRDGFTTNLYHSLMENEVYTFMDAELLGRSIDSLFDIIGTSKIAVVVFSASFASSDWCLRELGTIIHLLRVKQMLMIPIFYKVDVGELKHLTGETANYLDAHIAEHGETAVKKWKTAVTTLGNVSGLSYKDSSDERDFILNVIKKVKEKLEAEWEETCIPKSNPKDDVMECPTFEITWEGTEESMKELSWPKSVDVHPTKPWVLHCNFYKLRIWNYETRAIEKSFRVDWAKVAKFVPEKHWIVATTKDDTSFILVLDYNTSEKLKEFNAHMKEISSMAVHPTLPYVLTASWEDNIIKLWNWEDDWVCQQTFEGHSGGIRGVAFNPRDPHSFASVCFHFLKIWKIDSRVAEFTSPKFNYIYHVNYFVGNGDMLYIFSGQDVWHCGSKTSVQTLDRDVSYVINVALVHPKLPIILTSGSQDGGSFCIWNKNTYQLLKVCNDIDYLGRIQNFTFIEASEEVIIGCTEGFVLVKFAFAGKQSA